MTGDGSPGSGEPLDLDLAAAGLRADTRDLPGLVNALGTWLEESVPGMAEVQRKRAGLLDSRKVVVAIRCRLGDEIYVLQRDGAGARTRRAREVRGITLKSEELTLPEWLSSLASALVAHAEMSEASASALRGLLT